jgi:hypothetical protein
MRWVGHVTLTEEMRNAYRIMAGKPEGETETFRRPRRRLAYVK